MTSLPTNELKDECLEVFESESEYDRRRRVALMAFRAVFADELEKLKEGIGIGKDDYKN